jgi:plastocyanin
MPKSMHRSRTRLRWTVAAVLVALGPHMQGCRTLLDPFGQAPSPVAGRVVGAAPEAEALVVYLEPLDARDRREPDVPPVVARIRAGAFSSQVTVIAAGQAVEFAVEDEIRHQLFSYDEHNAFDLGTSDGQQSSRVVFEHPGPLRFYCSLHPAEGGHIFVTPGPHFAHAGKDGHFAIASVPPGPYRLKTWSARTLPTDTAIVVPLAPAERLEVTPRPLTEAGE